MKNLWKILDIVIEKNDGFIFPTYGDANDARQKVLESLQTKITDLSDEENTAIGLASIAAFQESKQETGEDIRAWYEKCDANYKAYKVGVKVIKDEFFKTQTGILFCLDYEIKSTLQPVIESMELAYQESIDVIKIGTDVGKNLISAGKDFNFSRKTGINSGLSLLTTYVSKITWQGLNIVIL